MTQVKAFYWLIYQMNLIGYSSKLTIENPIAFANNNIKEGLISKKIEIPDDIDEIESLVAFISKLHIGQLLVYAESIKRSWIDIDRSYDYNSQEIDNILCEIAILFDSIDLDELSIAFKKQRIISTFSKTEVMNRKAILSKGIDFWEAVKTDLKVIDKNYTAYKMISSDICLDNSHLNHLVPSLLQSINHQEPFYCTLQFFNEYNGEVKYKGLQVAKSIIENKYKLAEKFYQLPYIAFWIKSSRLAISKVA